MLIHVGYHKTGATWLQKHAFTEARGVTTAMGVPHHRIVEDIVRPALMRGVGRLLNGLVSRDELTTGHVVAPPRFARRIGRSRPVFGRLPTRALERRLDAGWRRQVAARIGDSYAQGNRRTVALTGLPLADLGYPLAGSI